MFRGNQFLKANHSTATFKLFNAAWSCKDSNLKFTFQRIQKQVSKNQEKFFMEFIWNSNYSEFSVELKDWIILGSFKCYVNKLGVLIWMFFSEKNNSFWSWEFERFYLRILEVLERAILTTDSPHFYLKITPLPWLQKKYWKMILLTSSTFTFEFKMYKNHLRWTQWSTSYMTI